jgi:hypothetical protein
VGVKGGGGEGGREMGREMGEGESGRVRVFHSLQHIHITFMSAKGSSHVGTQPRANCG